MLADMGGKIVRQCVNRLGHDLHVSLKAFYTGRNLPEQIGEPDELNSNNNYNFRTHKFPSLIAVILTDIVTVSYPPIVKLADEPSTYIAAVAPE